MSSLDRAACPPFGVDVAAAVSEFDTGDEAGALPVPKEAPIHRFFVLPDV